MFGPPMRIEIDGFGITLRPPKKEEVEQLAVPFSSLNTHMYTMRTFAVTVEDEAGWYDRVRKDDSSCQWAIVPDGVANIVGFTGLNGINPIGMSCTSGIIIADPQWRGKGVGTRAHLGRTYFAADFLNRYSIQSFVRAPNEASYKALERVGYRITGEQSANWFRNGEFMDTYVLSWLHPERLMFTRPNGYKNAEEKLAIERATEALQKARNVVTFL